MLAPLLVCQRHERTLYAVLSDSADPFLCPSCTAISQKAAIEGLRGCLNALIDEVRALKASVTALQSQKEPLDRGTAENPPHSESGEPWSTAVQGWKRRGRKSNRRDNCNENQLSQRTQSSDLQPRTSHAQEERGPSIQPQASRGKNRVRVVGACKIWGALKNSSVSSIKSVISLLCMDYV